MLDLKIAKPCNQSWTAMKGDERVRHCGACRKNVYNVAEMTEKEVEELIQRTEGHFCARIYRRTDGRFMTADCPKGVAAVRRKRTLAVTAAFGIVAGVLWPAARPATKGQVRVRRTPPVEIEVVGAPAVPEGMRMGQIAVIPKRENP